MTQVLAFWIPLTPMFARWWIYTVYGISMVSALQWYLRKFCKKMFVDYEKEYILNGLQIGMSLSITGVLISWHAGYVLHQPLFTASAEEHSIPKNHSQKVSHHRIRRLLVNCNGKLDSLLKSYVSIAFLLFEMTSIMLMMVHRFYPWPIQVVGHCRALRRFSARPSHPLLLLYSLQYWTDPVHICYTH